MLVVLYTVYVHSTHIFDVKNRCHNSSDLWSEQTEMYLHWCRIRLIIYVTDNPKLYVLPSFMFQVHFSPKHIRTMSIITYQIISDVQINQNAIYAIDRIRIG